MTVPARTLSTPQEPRSGRAGRHPAELAAARVAGRARAARTALVVSPLALWAAASLLGGSWWHPGTSVWAWVGCVIYGLVCFAALQELEAVVRHRRADAAAVAAVPALGGAVPAPAGADAQLQLDGRRVVFVVVDASDAGVRHGALVSPDGIRRGVSVRRLRGAARRAAAEPAVLVTRCDRDGCTGHGRRGPVEVLCAADLSP